MTSLAVEMYRSLPRHLVGRALSGRALARVPGLVSGPLTGQAVPLRLVDREPGPPPGRDWARLRPLLSGICGSDLGAVLGRTSLYFSGVVSMPFVPGHEVVAELAEDCADLAKGTRVVLDPVLGCAARGLDPCGECAQGHTNRCERVTVGHLRPGLQTGFCADTGGGWGEELLAHRSQLHVVPEQVPDQEAVLTEPLACAVHTALRARVPAGGRVLVSGAGIVGLLATVALRELTGAAELVVVAKHPHQRELARACGASEVVAPEEALRRVRRSTGAFRVQPEMAAPYLLGGVDVAVDAVGSRASLQTALSATRAGGRVVLSGMPDECDLSAAWFRELEVTGAYASAAREDLPDGTRRGAFEVAGDLVASGAVAALAERVARYPLARWREAIDHADTAGRTGTVKVAFDPRRRA